MSQKQPFYLYNDDCFFTDKLKLQFFHTKRGSYKQLVYKKEFEDNYTVVYIKNGSFEILYDNKIETLNDGDLFLCKPYNDFNLFALKSTEESNFMSINIHPVLLEDCDKESKIFRAFDNESSVYRQNKINTIHTFIEKAYEYKKFAMPLSVYKSLTILILFEVCRIYDETHQHFYSKFSHEYDLKIYTYIRSRSLTKIKMEDVMNEFFVSSWYVQKVCKKFYKATFGEMLKDMKMRSARRFMINKKTNDLKKIAELCGYDNYSAFYKVYIKYFGISPKEDLLYFKENNFFYGK